MLFTRRNPWRGFTLLELLVVVAIIATLISILLPSLSRAREQGKAAVCGSNLRQMATAATQYVGENRDYMNPLEDFRYPNGVEVEATYRALLFQYMGGNPALFDCPTETTAIYADGLSQQDIEYGGITPSPTEDLPRIYGNLNPLERFNQSGLGIAGAHWIRVRDTDGPNKRSDMPFGRPRESGYHEGMKKLTQVTRTSRLIWFGDGGSGNPNLWEDDAFWIKRVTPEFLDPGFNRLEQDDYGARRHDGRANYSFADGHVDRLNANRIACSREDCWWSVHHDFHKDSLLP